MSRGNLLFDRPDLTQKFGKLALYVSGNLTNAAVDFSYEGRLQIHNAIGDCWAELTNGTLPPGASVTVDNATHEVVVRWPAYSEAAVPIANADFELDDTSWLKGYGWTIENKGARPGDTSGAKAAAFRGSGESFMEATAFYPLTGTQESITYGVMIQQGGSSSGNVRAAAALRYYDVDYKLLTTDMGNVVKSGSDGEWKASGGSSTIPGSALYVRPTLWGLRKRQNKPLYADDFTWNLSGVAVGVHNPASYPVTIRVHDAGGRIADWSGTIDARGICTWDRAKSPDTGNWGVLLSNGNRTVTAVTAQNNGKPVHGTTRRNSGKLYYEAKFSTTGAVFNAAVGVEWGTGATVASTGGSSSFAYGWSNNAVVGNNGTYTGFSMGFIGGDVLMVAVDLDAGKLWFGKNGVWVGDPVAGTGQAYNIITAGRTHSPQASIYSNGYTLTANFAPADLVYSPPAGYSPWF